MITTEVVKLTPELAGQLLASNTKNRPVSRTTIDRYERIIRRGEWMLNGEPIIIFKNGQLGDGQHRCMAVLNTGIEIETVIMRGVDDDAFKTLNAGKPRSTSDVLAINGEINCRTLGSAARNYLIYFLKGREQGAITATQMQQCVDEHPHLRYWTQRYVSNKKAKLFPSMLCAFLTIASEKYGIEKLDKFFDQAVTGENLTSGDPAFVLRDRMLGQKTSRLSMIHSRAFIIKAINAYLTGKKLAFLRFNDDELTPKII